MRHAPPGPRDDARRRALSTNFLHDPPVVADVVAHAACAARGRSVVDLGAGAGALTSGASPRRGRRVIAVELDPRWARAPAHARARPWAPCRRRAATRCACRSRPSLLRRLHAPYAIGTKLVRRLLTDAHGLARAVLVLQREAALRLARGGRFAASWAPWFELDVTAAIPARAFRPVPSVDERDPEHRPAAHPVALARRLPRLRRVPARRFSGRGRTARPPRSAISAGPRSTRPGSSRDATPAVDPAG